MNKKKSNKKMFDKIMKDVENLTDEDLMNLSKSVKDQEKHSMEKYGVVFRPILLSDKEMKKLKKYWKKT